MSNMEIVNERVLTSPIPIIDGKITIEIPEWGIRIIAPVVQVKGRGTADADKLTILSVKHKLVLKLMLDLDWNEYTAKQIKVLVENFYKGKRESVDVNHYNRVISELLRKKCLDIDVTKNPPKYQLNRGVVDRALETGKFGK